MRSILPTGPNFRDHLSPEQGAIVFVFPTFNRRAAMNHSLTRDKNLKWSQRLLTLALIGLAHLEPLDRTAHGGHEKIEVVVMQVTKGHRIDVSSCGLRRAA